MNIIDYLHEKIKEETPDETYGNARNCLDYISLIIHKYAMIKLDYDEAENGLIKRMSEFDDINKEQAKGLAEVCLNEIGMGKKKILTKAEKILKAINIDEDVSIADITRKIFIKRINDILYSETGDRNE